MASPPINPSYGSSISPPYPSHSQLPQPLKRRNTDMPTSAPSIKRRKASTTSATSAHPLRQTSFPPELDASTPMAYSRSPSVDTLSVAGSVAGTKRKRARKMKAKDNDDTSSQRAKSLAPTDDGRTRNRGATEEPDDDDMEAIEEDGDMVANLSEESMREKERAAILTAAMDEEQKERHAAWRSAKLPDATVRRIVNQTLSQSVPPAVILAVKSAAKVFAGEILEGAKQVQTQWLELDADPCPPPDIDKRPEGEKETRRGPLMPDHLREALRRHVLSGKGGLAGQLGLWQTSSSSGVERFGVKVQGKRLFK